MYTQPHIHTSRSILRADNIKEKGKLVVNEYRKKELVTVLSK